LKIGGHLKNGFIFNIELFFLLLLKRYN